MVSIDIPTEDGGVCGFSSGGINFYCDKKSHQEVMKWYHSHHSTVSWYQTEYSNVCKQLEDLKTKLRELGKVY